VPQHPFGDDLRNIAQQLAREQVRDADLVDWLIDKRVDATLRLVDELWPTVTKVRRRRCNVANWTKPTSTKSWSGSGETEGVGRV
jgi:hypothetical protein